MSLICTISHSYHHFSLDVSFSVGRETLGILGASGSGKTTILRAIAGILRPIRGRIVADDVVFQDGSTFLPPRKRHVGMLFQHYALFPEMTILENITLCLSGNRKEKRQRAMELLGLFHLENQAHQKPGELSGGQRQRAALARMMSTDPRLLLLDEPFSALDVHLRQEMMGLMKEVLEDFSGSAILVSHNPEEVARLCDRLLIVDEGEAVEEGEVGELFQGAKTLAGARLLGLGNVIEHREDLALLGMDGAGALLLEEKREAGRPIDVLVEDVVVSGRKSLVYGRLPGGSAVRLRLEGAPKPGEILPWFVNRENLRPLVKNVRKKSHHEDF